MAEKSVFYGLTVFVFALRFCQAFYFFIFIAVCVYVFDKACYVIYQKFS
jgi:hypothetical protein